MPINIKTLKIIVILSFCFILIGYKQYMKLPNHCQKSCNKIKNEIDLINCLDACSGNSDDFIPVKGISFQKFFLLFSIILLSILLFISFINFMFINNDNRFISKINSLYSKFSKKTVFEKLIPKEIFNSNEKGYIRLNDHDE